VTGGLTIGVDTGGTFTDLIACGSDGAVAAATKVSTTPGDPSVGILEALSSVSGEVAAFLHGTTVGTNALLERRGAKTALLTTRGFRDVLELGRQNRPNLYDWFERKPEPLVPRELAFEIDERVSPHGPVGRALDESQVREVIRVLADRSVESVAVSLLHAYDTPAHERRIGEQLAAGLPTAHVSLSSDVLPDIMEYERASTTVANAYIAPVIELYLGNLVERLRAARAGAPLYVMQSNGGLGSARTIAHRAVQTMLSGPAAGVVGGLAAATGSRKQTFMTIDMGGTSFDIACSDGAEASTSRESTISGHPIAVAALDIHTLGAGGGSIAWVDSGGALRIGPQSAGSQPGPACYGRGGEDATVTDANVVLGRLGPELLGGRLGLDPDAAHRAIALQIARPLGIDVIAAARGMVEVVNAAMAKGMHLMSVARGRDPRDLGIVGFGGAGPLHACELAAAIGCSEVIVPVLPGNTSALGLLLANLRRERSEAVLAPLAALDEGAVESILDRLTHAVVADLVDDEAASETVTVQAVARLSYEGQRYQLDIPFLAGEWVGGRVPEGSLTALAERFRSRHRSQYGYLRDEGLTVFSLVAVGVAGVAGRPPMLNVSLPPAASGTEASRAVWFGGGFVPTRILQRAELPPGSSLAGPAIVQQPDTTTVVPPRWSARTDPLGNLVLRADG
jgi:N-methylhydantoinase A